MITKNEDGTFTVEAAILSRNQLFALWCDMSKLVDTRSSEWNDAFHMALKRLVDCSVLHGAPAEAALFADAVLKARAGL